VLAGWASAPPVPGCPGFSRRRPNYAAWSPPVRRAWSWSSRRTTPIPLRPGAAVQPLPCRPGRGRLPTVVFVIPDLHRQMHSGPVRVADAWLRRLVWRQDTRLVVTFDESRGRDVRSCCHRLGRGGRIPTIVAGPGSPGVATRSPTPTTRCRARSRPPTACRSSAMPVTRPPPPSRRWPTAPGTPS